ncbi:MAG: hypothetical protein M1838_003774 [Thelocarpon superellum]|nr:MAG: hypothetical protein M1838_003774 [Thelocarpon superellum]
MKLTFKDLKQQKFVIEAEPSESIADVKGKIFQEKGWDAAQQKLIYSGKILQDQNTVESYNIEEKGFIVCMVSKPRTAAATATSSAKAPATPASNPSSTPSVPAAPAPASPSTASNPPATPSPAPPALTAAPVEAAAFNDPSALTLGAQRSAVIANMEGMGFPRSEIDQAMRAAFYNPGRAVEYLLNGIPDSVEQEQRQAPPAAGSPAPTAPTAPTAAAALGNPEAATPSAETGEQPINLFEAAAQAGRASTGGTRSGGGSSAGTATGASAAGAAAELSASTSASAGAAAAGGLGNLDFLRQNPQFQQLRQVVQQQPHMLEPILQQVGAGNPQLAQLIGNNPDQFLQLLSEDVDDDAPLPPGAQAVSVTEEEREAIERVSPGAPVAVAMAMAVAVNLANRRRQLCRLGFPRDLVIQAYFACDKNEDLAANFLIDQPDEGEEQ